MTPTRRTFLRASAAFAGLQFLPSRVWASSPNEKLQVAQVGVGGMGGGDRNSLKSHPNLEFVGLCDVDSGQLAAASAQMPNAKAFADYREMFDQMGDSIDAVVVSTPDHTHAPASLRAMSLGKHVYCQKPLTHTVHEARQMRLMAEEKGLVTQMGVQIHSHVAYRRATKMIQSGVIGKVKEVHAWSNKNWGYDGTAPASTEPPPESVNWDLWLGSAPHHDYRKGLYHPGQWRRLLDFGCGTLGDMGVHIFDTPYRALKLTAPKFARNVCRPPTGYGHPTANAVMYSFPQTEFTTKTLHWYWYDGSEAPPKEKLGRDLPGQGAYFVGEGGDLLLPHIGEPVLLPEERFKDAKPVEEVGRNHYHEWVDACHGKGKTSAHFGYAGPLTEALLLGVVAARLPGRALMWDADALKVTNFDEANAFIRRDARAGFEVPAGV